MRGQLQNVELKNPSGVSAGVFSEKYYAGTSCAPGASFDHPGLLALQELAAGCESVLDCGCGIGAKLERMGNSTTRRVGVEWSESGVKGALARPGLEVVQGDIRHLPFPDNSFPLVYSAYVFEHVVEPELILREMLRVTRIGGKAAILCPQFGSPFFRSPCSQGNSWLRGVRLIMRDLTISVRSKDRLHWERVTPRATEQVWASDWDTTIEPALIPLLHYLRSIPGIRIERADSFWQLNQCRGAMTGKVRFKHTVKSLIASGFAGRLPLVRFWGPDVFIVISKGAH